MTKINLIDIGALGGLDLPWSKKRKFVDNILCFEPNDDLVIKPNFIKYNTAIWDFNGEADFFISGHEGSGSSLLEQNFEWVRENWEKIKSEGDRKMNSSWFERSKVTHQQKMSVKRLDDVLVDLNKKYGQSKRYHFLKSDTQSGEGYVLKGAENFLKNDCLGLELELFKYPLYKGMMLDNEVKEYLYGFGFEFSGWSGYKNSFNSQYDALFIKKEGSDQDKNVINLIMEVYNPKGKEKLIKQKSFVDKIKRRVSKLIG